MTSVKPPIFFGGGVVHEDRMWAERFKFACDRRSLVARADGNPQTKTGSFVEIERAGGEGAKRQNGQGHDREERRLHPGPLAYPHHVGPWEHQIARTAAECDEALRTVETPDDGVLIGYHGVESVTHSSGVTE